MRTIYTEEVGASISGTMMQNTIQSNFHVERLMKAWRIDKKTALKTIRATTQRYKRKQDPKMTRNSSTHDKATRYNRINDHLFMDTMFATSTFFPGLGKNNDVNRLIAKNNLITTGKLHSYHEQSLKDAFSEGNKEPKEWRK